MIEKPMLAVAAEDVAKLNYPVYASPKLDGIRCLKVGGRALSRKLKPIPNHFIRQWIESHVDDGVDGEIMVGANFHECQSGIMRADGEPPFVYHVFDYVSDLLMPFNRRLDALAEHVASFTLTTPRIKMVPHTLCHDETDLMAFETWCVDRGFEGTMIRSPQGPYKNGRSTLREGYLLKLKRWNDSEAKILEVREQTKNTNEATIDELGHTKRSSHKAGMVGSNTLGEFLVEDVVTGLTFSIGTGEGLTKEMRQEIWDKRDRYVGKILSYKYVPFGVKDLPRFPVFKGFRHPDDM